MIVEEIFRKEYGRVFAGLVRHFGDFQIAEDALQDAFVIALDVWPQKGVPEKPAAWITTVARNGATSKLRHETLARQKHEELREEEQVIDLHGDDIPDERLRLIFTCCHPALGEEARIALTLQTMCGVPTPAIARLFLVPEPTIAQRLVRAKKKIKTSGIPFEIPPADRIDERLDGVLAVVYLMFTEGYATTDGEVVVRAELCDEAIRLARVLAHLLPTHAETRGLLALMILHHARRDARTDANGEIVALEDQDPALWKKDEIDEGVRLLDEALAREAPGAYQIQAAIAALHAAKTKDWKEIAGLYGELEKHAPSPSVSVARAIAEGMAFGFERGLEALATMPDGPLVRAARADLLRRAGRTDDARRAYGEAIAVARNDRERRFLERRLANV